MTATVDALGGTSFFLPAFFAFPFFTLPPCHQAIILNAPIALVMKPQIRNRSLPTQDRGQAQGSRSRRARRLSPRCFPGGVVSVSEDPKEVSLTRKPSQQREEGRLPQIQRHPSLPLPLLPPKAPKTTKQWNQSAVLSVSALCMYRRVGSCESDNVVKDKTGCQLFSQES